MLKDFGEGGKFFPSPKKYNLVINRMFFEKLTTNKNIFKFLFVEYGHSSHYFLNIIKIQMVLGMVDLSKGR